VPGVATSSVAACFSSPNVHRVDCASFLLLGGQHTPQAGFWALLVPMHNFEL